MADGPWFPPLAAQPVPVPQPEPDTASPGWLEPDPEPEVPNRRRWLTPVFGAVAITAAAVVSAIATGSPSTTLAEPSLGTAQDMTPADWCPELHESDRIVSSGKGDLSTGTGVILWLEHAYYVERDPAAVRSVFAPGAAVPSAERTRAAIDNVVPGTKHCVEIVTEAPARFHVRVDELKPDGGAVTWGQTMIVTNVGGRPMISASRAVDDQG